MRKSFLSVCAMFFFAITLLAVSTAMIAGASMCASIFGGDLTSAGASFKVFFVAVVVIGISYHLARKCDNETNPPLL
ncbi:hypothetical protein HZC00_01320 [Candidatus Kaiserbacteria bacterium]|nr:hypothetical protein [Candidatus Kaiserbacteria bacterium]